MTTETPDQINQRLTDTAEELRSLGDCEGVPTDPSELSESEQTRFKQLKEKLIYLKKMKEANDKITA